MSEDTGEPLVETGGLTKRYGKKITAVESLDLNVGRGEVYGFLGPNGAGKTTTLRMLLGLIKPSSGRATVAGQRPGSPTGLQNVGSLVESPAFYPYLSGRDNLKVIARYCGVPQSRIAEALDTVELIMEFEKEFGLSIPDEAAEKIATVGDAVAYLESNSKK